MLRTACGLCCLVLLSGCGGAGGDSPEEGADLLPSEPLVLWGTPVTRLWEGEAYAFAPRARSSRALSLDFQVRNLPAWASFDAVTGRLSGIPGAADVGTYSNIQIGATDGTSETWLPSFDLRVDAVSHGAAMLTWIPPSQNTDNTPLDDLAGFKIYGGDNPLFVSELAYVDGSGISSYLIDNLTPGRYYFASAAVNTDGVESNLSNFTLILVR